jgi:hypothetical protein
MLQVAQIETERALKLSGSKFIKQGSSNLVDLSPKNKEGFSYIPFKACYRNGGIQFVPYTITCYFICCFNLWGEVTLLRSPGNILQLRFFFVSL